VSERFGPYEVVAPIARGAMGAVYRVRDPVLDREAALKVLLRGEGASAVDLERFRREARAAGRLRHPGIAAVHGVGTDGREPYIVMDLVEGESLGARLAREGALEPREAARIAARVARALDYAHGRGVLHRDVKPDNVLLVDGREPVLTDFGLARLLGSPEERLTRTGEMVGTPVYMPPEQADGGAELGPPADVYGLGATLYHLLTGRPPYLGSNLVEVMTALLEDEPARPASLRPGLDPALEAIVLRCLAKDPGARFASAGALADALERWLEPAAAAPGRAAPLLPWVVAGALGVAAAGLGVALAAARGELARARAALAASAAKPAAGGDGSSRGAGPDAGADGAEPAAGAGAVEAPPDDGAGGGTTAAQAALERANALLAAGEHAAAVRAYDALIERLPDRPGPFRNRALARSRLGDHAGAAEDAGRALALDPNDATAYFVRALARREAGRLEAAVEDLTRCLEGDPGRVEAWAARASARALLDDAEGAIADCDEALAREPDHAAALAERAANRLRLGRVDAALADLERVLEIDPDRSNAWANLAALCEDRGELRRAQAAARRAVELDPELIPPRVTLARALARQGRPGQAIGALERALLLRPGDPDLLLERGKCRVARGDPAGAAEDYGAALEAVAVGSNTWLEARCQRAQVREGLGDWSGAARDWAAALEASDAPGLQDRIAERLARARAEAEAAGD